MKKVSIVGAGQLGSRHLQGLMKAQTEMEVWVVDQSKESLSIAKERCEQIEPASPKKVTYVTCLDALPASLDLVIVATGSKPRAAIVESLLSHSKVNYLVLEKFLFTRMSEYDKVGELLVENNVSCWVNCARRMDDFYSKIKKLIDPEMPVEIEYGGQNWGMCCNSVHFIDLWMYLAGDCSFNMDISGVKKQVYDSKRPGYIELMGKEIFKSLNNDLLTLTCSEDYIGNSVVKIKNADKVIEVNEAKGEWYFNGQTFRDRQLYQSEKTGILADEIFETGTCRLVNYKNSVEYHKPYLKTVLDFVNKIQGTSSDSCPIT